MLKRRITYNYGIERSKGEETWETYGDYLTYDLYPQEYINYLKHLSETQTDVEDYDELNMPDEIKVEVGGTNIENVKAIKPRISGFTDMKYDVDHENMPVRDLEPDDYMSSDDARLVEYREKYDIHDNSVTRPLGTALVEFLNFDIDAYIAGEFEADVEFDTETIHTKNNEGYTAAYPDRIVGWRRLNNHDLSNRKNRHEVLYNFIYGGDDGLGDYSEQKVPFLIRMFEALMVNFDNWTYNEEGIEKIKELQRTYIDLCDQYYGLKLDADVDDKRTALEKYWDTMELEARCKNVKEAQKLIRDIVHQSADIAYYIVYNQKKDEYVKGLEQALNAEFMAVLSRPYISLKRCEYCDKFILGSAKARYCTTRTSMGIYKVKQAEKTYDTIFQIPSCSEIATNKNYNDKQKDSRMAIVFLDEKRRLEANMPRFLEIISLLEYDKLKDTLVGTREKYEAVYLKKIEGLTDEDKIKELEEEYRKLLIDAVNSKLKEISIVQYNTWNFDRRKRRK